MEYREFGKTGMTLSTVGLGGLLAHYWEGESGHPPPEEKQQIYLQAAESGINLFDTGYGDEVHIPEELKGHTEERNYRPTPSFWAGDVARTAPRQRRSGNHAGNHGGPRCRGWLSQGNTPF